MSAASRFRDSLKEDYKVDLNEEEEGDEMGVILNSAHRGFALNGRGAYPYEGRSYPLVKEIMDSGGGTRPDGYVGKAGLTVTRGPPAWSRPQYQILFNDYERGRSRTVEDTPYNFSQYNERGY